ncbi:sugar kinase [Corynebacterium mendelii]|uniref:Sugar kinase n=1 Tax=Corynebacterium mendelii TaxID=2765362 RepID=A0A939E1K6_9CORY|nr:sugar kinase [Corynebacterium mendelii]MBN9644011.1 sugar kinase [Corynebacterium mendelii]
MAHDPFDLISLGEVMLRLDPGHSRIHTSRTFTAWEGGGEYNVARNLHQVYGHRTAVITALVDNPIGRLIENLICTGGVDCSLIDWVADDGVGARARNGLNFTERGFGVRGARGASDRAHTAIAAMNKQVADFDRLFTDHPAGWLHSGGIYAALSPTSGSTLLAAVTAAKKHGMTVSFDQNFRPSLWAAYGDNDKLRKINRRVIDYVDVLIAGPRDFKQCLGIDLGVDDRADPAVQFEAMTQAVTEYFPGVKVLARTVRHVHHAGENDWRAMAWSPDTGITESVRFDRLPIYDRVGGGDGFATGLIAGLQENMDLARAVNYGVATGALAMSTPGDWSMDRRSDVEALLAGHNADTAR